MTKLERGVNDLKTTNPDVAEEWNHDKNGDVNASDVLPGSHKKVWWICSKGHEWEAEIKSRCNGNNCPYCSGRYAVKGKNDLQTVNPTIAKEWCYEKNIGLTPADVLPNSGKKVWWKCKKGHNWQTTVYDRSKGNGCPYCSGQRILKGFNDLQTVNPALAIEWNYEKNGDLKPEDVTANNGKKVWWRCSKGHEWQAKIYHRNNGSGCPICKSERNTSLPEFAIVYYLKKSGIEVKHSYKEHGYELDVFIPSYKAAIEFDGFFWHKNKLLKDLEKNRKCDNDGIKLYRIREELPPLNDTSIDYFIQKDKKIDLSKAIERIIYEITGISADVDLERDSIDIENLREYIEKDNSLLILNPNVAKEWNNEKNGKLKPEFFASNSSKKVWWKCEKGHEWQASIQSRNNGIGCPYCSGRYAIKGENDLLTVNPDLAKEWNYEKNKGLTPSDVLPNSEKKVWWKCKKGHEWQSVIGNRQKGQGCPFCSGRSALKGYNDLQTVSSDLAKEWNHQKNGSLNPSDVTAGSNKKVWWKCSKGHEWQALICHRNKGSGCPFCASKKVLKGYNDLATLIPELLKDWCYEKNEPLKPDAVTKGSSKKVWWKCHICDYEWETAICNRTGDNATGCPKCQKSNATDRNTKPVLQLSLDGSVIAEFKSTMEAERQTGIKSIRGVCGGERKTAGGYVWKYKQTKE